MKTQTSTTDDMNVDETKVSDLRAELRTLNTVYKVSKSSDDPTAKHMKAEIYEKIHAVRHEITATKPASTRVRILAQQVDIKAAELHQQVDILA